jgi:cysteine desulfurase
VDLLSLSAHKFYGPKGVGLLFVRDGLPLNPTQPGGGQESGRRSGTHNTPLIVGMAEALVRAEADRVHVSQRLRVLRDRLIARVLSEVPGSSLSGDPQERLPSHASFVLDGVDGNTVVQLMDARGIAISSGSACRVGNPSPSRVLLALGYTPQQALGGIRVTLGRQTDDMAIVETVRALKDAVMALRTQGTGAVTR